LGRLRRHRSGALLAELGAGPPGLTALGRQPVRLVAQARTDPATGVRSVALDLGLMNSSLERFALALEPLARPRSTWWINTAGLLHQSGLQPEEEGNALPPGEPPGP